MIVSTTPIRRRGISRVAQRITAAVRTDGVGTTRWDDTVSRPRAQDRVLTGEPAVVALYDHWAALNALATTVLRDRHAAQDVVQDVFVGVLRTGVVFDDEAAAARYARTAVLNGCRSVLRRRGTALRHLRLARADDAPPADRPVLLAEGDARVLALLDRLPVRQREVLGLRYLHHLDDAEIAAVLGIGASAVRSTASRALAALTRHLEEDR